MPELPEVETVRRGLTDRTLGLSILDGQVLLPRTIASPISPQHFVTHLKGTEIASWHRRGKYLLGQLIVSPGQGGDSLQPSSMQPEPTPAGWLGVHLRMTGQLLWLTQSTDLHKHTRVRLFFPKQQELRFVDQRTFGQMWWVPPNTEPATVISGLSRLGPEPLSDDFSVAYLVRQLCDRKRPIKSALLDQSIIAGLGNIYADEALFVSGLRPTRRCQNLSKPDIQKLHQAIVQVLTASLEAGGTTFSDFRDVLGVNGNYGGVAWVYGRTGEPCRSCQHPIARTKLAGRSTHYCPTCQP